MDIFWLIGRLFDRPRGKSGWFFGNIRLGFYYLAVFAFGFRDLRCFGLNGSFACGLLRLARRRLFVGLFDCGLGTA